MLLCMHVCIYSIDFRPHGISPPHHLPPFPRIATRVTSTSSTTIPVISCMSPLCMYVTLVIAKLLTASKEEPCFSSPVITPLIIGIFVDFLLQPVHAIYCKVLKIRVKLIITTRVRSCQWSLPELS